MTPEGLFGVVVRSIGLILVLAGLLAFFAEPVAGIGYALVGVGVIAAANWIAGVCYSPKWSLPTAVLRNHGAASPPRHPE